ncbi:MAG: MBL fold metallo-hydrolase [Paracoccus sp. (in: a-proteobacteria)]
MKRNAGLRAPLTAIGLGVAAYSLATSYRGRAPGRPIRMDQHRLLDAAQGAACLALARDVDDPEARKMLRGYGAFSLAVAAASSPPGPAGIAVPADAWATDLGDDLACLRCGIVNVAFIGAAGAGDRDWYLVDAGVPGSAAAIQQAARRRYGASRPAAILLTHGHFDHVGALHHLAETWDAPIYAHPDEHPFLTGRQAYPPAAPEVGGGMMAELSWLFPRHPIDVSHHLRALPEDGRIPGLEDWRWIHTPGHTPGHVSFWNAGTRALLAGDAVITTRQESLRGALLPQAHLQGPPAYFTPDWTAADLSVRRLADLEPRIMVTGHGPALQGDALSDRLHALATTFRQHALPNESRYLRQPS